VLIAAAGCIPGPDKNVRSRETPSGPDSVRSHQNRPAADTGKKQHPGFQPRFKVTVSFGFEDKPLQDIIRNISAASKLDIALSPEVLEKQRKSRNVYSLYGSDLDLTVFLDRCARLMDCSYIQDDAPDIWFVDENSWLKQTQLIWKWYPSFLARPSEPGRHAEDVIAELQKGLSWLRNDIRIMPSPQHQRVMVNSTQAGHRRLKKLFDAFMDRKFVQFERMKPVESPHIRHRLLSAVACPESEYSVNSLVRKIVKKTGVNIGYNSSLTDSGKAAVPVPLDTYTVKELLDKIIANSDYSEYHFEDTGAVWLSHPEEGPFCRSRYVLWGSLDVYIVGIRSIAKFIKGEEIVKAVKKEVYPRSWKEPAMVIRYFRSYDVLIIVNRPKAVHETIRFLKYVKIFRKLHAGK